jgi:hypothetical protein
MKYTAKSFLSAFVLSVAAVSCQSDGPTAPATEMDNSKISFSYGDRGRLIDDNTFTIFHVFGGYWDGPNQWALSYEPIFDGRKVTRVAGTYWDYENHEKWLEGRAYKFYAIGMETPELPANVKTRGQYVYNPETGVAKNYYPIVIDDITIDDTLQSDIVLAESDEIIGKAPGWNDVVALTFKHILANVRVVFVNRDAARPVTVSDVRIEHFYSRSSYGSYYSNGVPTVCWSPWPDSDSRRTSCLTLRFGGEGQCTLTDRAVTDSGFVIPFDYTGEYSTGMGSMWRVTLKYNVIEDGVTTEYSAKLDPLWEEGGAYAYNIYIGNPPTTQ